MLVRILISMDIVGNIIKINLKKKSNVDLLNYEIYIHFLKTVFNK